MKDEKCENNWISRGYRKEIGVGIEKIEVA
jgi:hypothetical protein